MSTGVLNYGPSAEDDGFGFAVDVVGEFDVEDYPLEDKKKPWEVENAIGALERRKMLNRWLRAAGANSSKSVNKASLEPLPGWQSFIR